MPLPFFRPLLMRLMCFTTVLLFCGAPAFGQTPDRQITATVLDFGQLYSTFDWDLAAVAELKASLGAALAETVVRASTEAAWPSGIASLEARTQNRPLMASYKLYYLTTVGEDKTVLVAPVADNRQMPENMQSTGDLYFLVSNSAVTLSSVTPPVHSIAAPSAGMATSTSGFAAQMAEIIRDFPSGFVNVTNAMIDEDEEGMTMVYGSRVPLDGATQLSFTEDLLSASTIFHAVFPGSPDPATARQAYRELVRKIELLQLPCCPLAKSDEQVEGNRHSQTFLAYDPQGKLHADYRNMVITVRLEQGETFAQNGLLVSDWRPVLDVYEQ